MAGLLSRERIVAEPGFNRWLVPPAALAIHLSIGMAYGFSVFWLPLSRPSAIDRQAVRAPDATGRSARSAGCSRIALLLPRLVGGGVRPLARARGPAEGRRGRRVLLGRRLLHLRARRAHPPDLAHAGSGSGVIGGCGLGLGYISPVSTLIKWFPDRRGLATGMAIMGFGGGAMIGAPLADRLMRHFATPDVGGRVADLPGARASSTSSRCWRARSATGYRRPDWKPAGWTPKVEARRMITTRHVHVDQAWKTPQFWLAVGRALPQRERRASACSAWRRR